MEKLSVLVGGFPPGMNTLKLKVFVEKQIGSLILENVERRNNGNVLFRFRNAADLQKFHDAAIKEVQFGSTTHKLTVIEDSKASSAKGQERGQSSSSKWDEDPWRKQLYITKIPKHFHSYLPFRYHFEKFGKVEKCFLSPDKIFGHVTFRSHDNALAAKYGAVNAGPASTLQIYWADKEGRSVPGQKSSSQQRPLPRSATWSGKQRERPQKGPAKKELLFTNKDDLCTNTHYWNEFKELPAPENTICVLAQNCDRSVHTQNVKMHFENKKRSNGGPVKTIVRMVDGLLIVFENAKDCESCLKKEVQKFDGKDLTIAPKTVPSYYQRKFVVEGVGPETTSDTLIMFLECCSRKETAPQKCQKQSRDGVYLIEYGDDFDVEETDHLLSKIQKQTLENQRIKGCRLLHTDCLKLAGIPSETSDDVIRLVLESKKRANGGRVTRIDQMRDGTALVYFAAYTDAERVYDRFKKPCVESIIINQQPVEVELYFHAFYDEHKKLKTHIPAQGTTVGGADSQPQITKQPLGTITLKWEENESMFFFLRQNEVHCEKLKAFFANLGAVELCNTAKKGLLLKCFPDKALGSEDQRALKDLCLKTLQEFLMQYSSTSKTFEKSKLQDARSSKIHPFLERIRKTSNHGDFRIRWEPNDPTVTVTGLKKAVEETMDEIEKSINFINATMPVNAEQYRTIKNCGILDELKEKNDKVQIQFDDAKRKITLAGADKAVSQFQIQALALLNAMEKKRLASFDPAIVRYLGESTTQSENTRKKVQEKLISDDIQADFSTDGEEPYLKVRSEDGFKNAVKVIKQMVVLHSIETDASSSSLVRSPPWKGFQQSLRSNGLSGLYVKRDNSIVMVGLQSEVEILRSKVASFLDENVIRRLLKRMSYGKARYIQERSEEFSAESCKKMGIKLGLSPEKGGCVFVEGRKPSLDVAQPELENLLSNLIEIKHTLKHPGIKGYFLTSGGKQFLETTEQVNNCIILAGSQHCEEYNQHNKYQVPVPLARTRNTSATSFQEQKLASATVENRTLNVYKTDISKHKCDVIVNASNAELTLLPGGVSGVIKKLDVQNGDQIQNEMNEKVKENRGNFLPGDAIMTSAGNIYGCKKIVHAIGPRWNPTSSRADPSLVLKACVLKSLEEVEKVKMNSVSIPAISTGVFGGSVKTCIPLIIEAVTDYFKDTQHSSIKKVDFVEISKQEVLDGFVKEIKKLEQKETAKSNSPVQQQIPPVVRQRSSLCTVALIQGDISTQSADVIVNTVQPQDLTNMTRGSVISKALAKRVDAVVHQQCAMIPPPHNLGDVHETSAGQLRCKKLYHALVGNYDQLNSQFVVQSVVKKSLQMAERSSYQSIVFPAIATGGFQHPPQLVAKWMNEIISNFTGRTLQNVNIVLHPSNPTAIAAFNAEFKSQKALTLPTFASGQKARTISVSFGSVSVSVIQGDITDQDTDVILNSTNAKFDLKKGMISAQIIQKGGQQILTDALEKRGNEECIVTRGGNLPCKFIIHVVAPSDAKELRRRILMALRLAQNLNISSISIPAIGTGRNIMDNSTVASAIRASIISFAEFGSSCLKEIRVVVYDQLTFQDFEHAFVRTNSPKIAEDMKEWHLPTQDQGTEDNLDLFFYSTNEEDINNAIKCINEETKKVVQRQVIEDDVIERLSTWEIFEILKIVEKNKVKIMDISSQYIKRLTLEGLTRDVFEAKQAITDILKDFAAAETSASYVTWKRLTSQNTWIKVPLRSAHTLEKAFMARKNDSTNPNLNMVKVPIFHNDSVRHYMVDLSTLENDQNSSNPPRFRRKVKEKDKNDGIPAHWDDMKGQSLLQVPLIPGSTEYQNVLTKFQNSGLRFSSIGTIEKVQNVFLYKQYIAKKAEVTEKLKRTGKLVERELFHGTTEDNKIMLQGFDRSFAGKHATLIGRGVYFATTASYSHGYASPVGGYRRMFLANVVTGDYCQGYSSMIAPPARPNTHIKNDLYDSVVNNVSNPSMFVIFKDASAYPSYRIKYT